MDMYRPPIYDANLIKARVKGLKRYFLDAAAPWRKVGKILNSITFGLVGNLISKDLPILGTVVSSASLMGEDISNDILDSIANYFGAFSSPQCQKYICGMSIIADHEFCVNRVRNLLDIAKNKTNFFDTGDRGQGTYHSAPAFILLIGFVIRDEDVQKVHREVLASLRGNRRFYKRVSCCLDQAYQTSLDTPYKRREPAGPPCAIFSVSEMIRMEVEFLNRVFGDHRNQIAEYNSFCKHLKNIIPELRKMLSGSA